MKLILDLVKRLSTLRRHVIRRLHVLLCHYISSSFIDIVSKHFYLSILLEFTFMYSFSAGEFTNYDYNNEHANDSFALFLYISYL